MNGELKHKHFDTTMSEWIARLPNELPVDAVGLWQFVPDGRYGFGLDGDDLVAFVRRAVTALVERGAWPVVGGGQGPHAWIVQRQYGSSPAEIIDNVLQEWIAGGMRDEDPGGLWFALPEHAWMPPG